MRLITIKTWDGGELKIAPEMLSMIQLWGNRQIQVLPVMSSEWITIFDTNYDLQADDWRKQERLHALYQKILEAWEEA